MKIKYSNKLFENLWFYADVAKNWLHIESDWAEKDWWTLMEITWKQTAIDNIVKKYWWEIIVKFENFEDTFAWSCLFWSS